MRRPCLRELFLLPLIGSLTGCVIVLGDGSGGGGETGQQPDPLVLPEPEVRRVDAPELTAAQRARQLEADTYTRDFIYQGRAIEKTVQGYSGMTYDYLKVAPLGIELPELQSLLPVEPGDGLQLGLPEVVEFPELWGPLGATVFARPDFSKYVMNETGATSVQDWVQNHQIPAVPDGPNRLYAGLDIVAPNRGVFARINMFKPEVAQNSFSVVELIVGCPAVGAAEEFLGVLLSVDRVNLEADPLTLVPPQVRFHVEYWKLVNGKYVGSFDQSGGHFDPQDDHITDVGAPVPHVSVAGGEQWEHALLLVMAPNGDWLVSYNYQYIGAFRAERLNHKMLHQGACRAQVYGEVYNPHPEQGWVATEMGSGQFSGAPSGYTAWARQIRYLDPNYLPLEPPIDDMAHWSKPYYSPCYDRQPLVPQGSAGPLMTFGGPGGKDPTCAAKMP